MITWKLEKKHVNELCAYDKNPRTISESQRRHLSDSIDRFGIIDKPVVNLDGTIIGGHQRIEVLISKGAEEVECWIPHRALDEKEVEECNIRLNRGGSFDFDILGNLYEIGDLLTWGFDELELGLGKDEKPKKEPKPQITFEFSTRDIMLEVLPQFEEICVKTSSKMKVRG